MIGGKLHSYKHLQNSRQGWDHWAGTFWGFLNVWLCAFGCSSDWIELANPVSELDGELWSPLKLDYVFGEWHLKDGTKAAFSSHGSASKLR